MNILLGSRFFLEGQRMLVKQWSILVLLLVCHTAIPSLMCDLREGSSRGLEEGGTAKGLGFKLILLPYFSLVAITSEIKTFLLYHRRWRQFLWYLCSGKHFQYGDCFAWLLLYVEGYYEVFTLPFCFCSTESVVFFSFFGYASVRYELDIGKGFFFF